MNELQTLIEENTKLEQLLSSLRSSLDQLQADTMEIDQEIADDPQEVASFEAMLVVAGQGIPPLKHIPDDKWDNRTLIGQQAIDKGRQEMRSRLNTSPKSLK